MRGLRLFIVALFGLSFALAGCDSEPPRPTVDANGLAALGTACTGHAVAGAGSLSTSAAVPNHLVLLNASGQESDIGRWMPAEWTPASLADAELVACAQEPVRTVIEVCPYTGSDVTRTDESRSFTVVEASTAKILAAFSIVAEPRNCHQTEAVDLTELEGQIETATVVDHLAGLVQNGRFVDPDASGATAEPGKTSEPGTTDEPTGSVRVAELRQALADGLVSVTGTGDGLQSLDLEVTSEVDFDLDVSIEVGTQLEPGVRGTQLMVVIDGQTVSLAANATVDITLDVACAEMHQDQPTGDDTFHVLDNAPVADLVRLLESPDFSDQSGRVQQFAVWTITNNPRRNDYVGLTSGFDIFGTGPDDDEITAIRDLFDTAGIDTTKYRALK